MNKKAPIRGRGYKNNKHKNRLDLLYQFSQPRARGDRPQPPLTARKRAGFNRLLLPDPAIYFTRELSTLNGRDMWRSALCPFHDDKRPSLRVNITTGGWRCMACGVKGDLLDFHMRRYGMGFKDACRALGAWVERPGRAYGRSG